MSLPVYQHINLKSASLENLTGLLTPEINLKHPVAVNIKGLGIDDQREVIGLIENFFMSHNLSFKFPYPLYLITDHEESISRIPLVNSPQELPKFFNQKESRMNVKESHLAGKNKLLQQEVRNTDTSSNINDLLSYGESHRTIFELEIERKFYRSLLSNLLKAKKNG
ncbi:MAG: hypothetical protein ACLGHN_04185 [Bacteriovoracia bacterium]